MLSNFAVGDLTFNADFDSGNLAGAERLGPSAGPDAGAYALALRPDVSGGPGAPGLRGWFYFSVSGAGVSAGRELAFYVKPFSAQRALVEAGWRPVARPLRAEATPWARLASPAALSSEAPGGASPGAPPSWALRFRYALSPADAAAGGVEVAFAPPFPLAAVRAALDAARAAARGRLFCAEATLATSLEGRPMPLLVLSSLAGAPAPGEAGTAGAGGSGAPPPPPPPAAVVPFAPAARKRAVVLTARVHPGETPGSFALDGALELLSRAPGSDARADALRAGAVFYIVPVLNPDGVALGCYRYDTRGVNLNRAYADPDAATQPGAAALKALVVALAAPDSPTPLALLVDFHAHAGLRGAFFIGNDGAPGRAFARAVALHSGWFDPDACVWGPPLGVAPRPPPPAAGAVGAPPGGTREDDKEGSGRVALARATGVAHVYTLELHYSTGTRLGVVPPAAGEGGGGGGGGGGGRAASPPTSAPAAAPIAAATALARRGAGAMPLWPPLAAPPLVGMGPAAWREVGRAVLYAHLELSNAHPASRVPASPFRSLEGLHAAARADAAAAAAAAGGGLRARPPWGGRGGGRAGGGLLHGALAAHPARPVRAGSAGGVEGFGHASSGRASR